MVRGRGRVRGRVTARGRSGARVRIDLRVVAQRADEHTRLGGYHDRHLHALRVEGDAHGAACEAARRVAHVQPVHELLSILLLGEVRISRTKGAEYLRLEGGDGGKLRQLAYGHAQAGDRLLLTAAGGADEGVAAGAAADGRASFLVRGHLEARAAEPIAALIALDALAPLPTVFAKGDVALEAVLDAVLALAATARAVHDALVARHQVAVAVHVAVAARPVAAEGARAGVLPLPEADIARRGGAAAAIRLGRSGGHRHAALRDHLGGGTGIVLHHAESDGLETANRAPNSAQIDR